MCVRMYYVVNTFFYMNIASCVWERGEHVYFVNLVGRNLTITNIIKNKVIPIQTIGSNRCHGFDKIHPVELYLTLGDLYPNIYKPMMEKTRWVHTQKGTFVSL